MLISFRPDCIRSEVIVIRFLIASIVLLGAVRAQTPSPCPELLQLSADAKAAFTRAEGLEGQDRCNALIHYSVAWADLRKYAQDHSDLCGISESSLNDIAKSHRRAVRTREDACGGRRAWPLSAQRGGSSFPPEIRPRW